MTKYSYAIFFVDGAGSRLLQRLAPAKASASTFVAFANSERDPKRSAHSRPRPRREAASAAMGPVILSSSELARMREQVRAPPGRSPRAPSPSASAHPFPLSSFPPDRTTPVHAQLRDATITPETRDDDRAHLKALSDARAARWPNTLEVRDRPAALVATDPPIPFWTRRDETSKRALAKKKRKSASRRTRRTNRADVPTSEPTRPTTSNRLAARTKKPLARRSPPRRSRRAAPPIAPRLRRAPRRVSAKSRAPTRCCTTRRNA